MIIIYQCSSPQAAAATTAVADGTAESNVKQNERETEIQR